MSFTYSVTAWGFEASRASTSSALRSDLSGFLPASAATESPALVMSPKTARLVRVAMGVLFSSLGAALCKRGARGGGGGGRRASAACGGGYGPRSGNPAVSASTAARRRLRCGGVAVARLGRAAAPCGAAQRDEMAVIVNSRNACCAAVSLALAGALLRLGPEGASEAFFCTRGVLQRRRGGNKRSLAKATGPGLRPVVGEVDSSPPHGRSEP